MDPIEEAELKDTIAELLARVEFLEQKAGDSLPEVYQRYVDREADWAAIQTAPLWPGMTRMEWEDARFSLPSS